MNLRFLREKKLLSQERLSEMSGLSLRTIQRLYWKHSQWGAALSSSPRPFSSSGTLSRRCSELRHPFRLCAATLCP